MECRLRALFISLLLVAACIRAPTDRTPTQASAYEQLLSVVPDTPETRSRVFILNYALIRELFGIPLPGAGASQQAMEEYYSYQLPLAWTEDFPDFAALEGLGRMPYLSDGYAEFTTLGQSLGRNLDVRRRQRQYLGFDIRNENQAMVAGPPGLQLEVLRGRFDPAAFDRAIGACSGECTPPDSREEHQGIQIYSWGKDLETNSQKLFGAPVFDQFGIGGRIAVQKNYVFRTRETEGMKALVDALLGKRPSLVDREEFRLLARGMSELGAYAVFLSDQARTVGAVCNSLRIGEQDCARIRAFHESQQLLGRYQAFAAGVGKDKTGAYTSLVLVHTDDATAKDNAVLLRRRIEDAGSQPDGTSWVNLDTNTMEVRAEGRVLLAKLRPTEGRPPIWPPLWIDWGSVFLPDPLLMNE